MRLRSTTGPASFRSDGDDTASGHTVAPGSVDPLVVAAYSTDTPYVVAARAIRSSILQSYGETDRRSRACALIGVDCDEALAVLAANLGVVMAQAGTQTLLVDTNRAHPRVATLFQLVDHADHQVTAVPGLMVQGTGSDGGGSEPIERRSLLEQHDAVAMSAGQMIAVAAIHSTNGATSIADAITGFDAAVVVVRKHRTKRSDVRGLIEVLDQHGIPITGTVLV
ncbi:hypothetical protein U1707_11415 [Sphingomonas sp. PB2P12]|uniref:hypothetical protein n=1 Tax=Sphingomonas sandaracina TaxID=3096157 RepID=UPI002FC72F2D